MCIVYSLVLPQMVSQLTGEGFWGNTGLKRVAGDQCGWTAGVWSNR